MKIAVNEMNTIVWIRPENKSKYAWRAANGIGARNILFQFIGSPPALKTVGVVVGIKVNIVADILPRPLSTIVRRAQPATALPNKRNVS